MVCTHIHLWKILHPIIHFFVCCAVQTDKMGKDALKNNEHLYLYKGKVGIPTLAMIDDIAKISECGTPSVMDNAYVNARITRSCSLTSTTMS